MKFLLLLFTLLLTACDQDNKPQTRAVHVWLGDPLSQLASVLGKDLTTDCDDQLCFYRFFRPVRSGDVLNLMLGGEKKFQIDGIFSLTVVLYKSDDNGRINSLSFSPVGLPEDALHSDVKRYFYQLVDKLQAADWQRFIGQQAPRLPGSEVANTERIEKALAAPTLSLPYNDPTLRLNMQQWLELPMLCDWYFYRGNDYLILSFLRNDSETAPGDRGTYLITLKFISEQRQYSRYFEYEVGDRWKTRLPGLLKEMAKARAAQEQQLRKMGIHIDESYRDPDIFALKNTP